MIQGYWHQISRLRLQRRRVIAAFGVGAGTALLAACGGGSDNGAGSGTPKSASGLVSPVLDETKSVKRGGRMLSAQVSPISLDPHLTTAGVLDVWHNYSPLFKISEGYLKNSNGDIEGELVDSWEFSPDKTTLTLKITRDVAFAPLAPVNGRAVDAQDVAFSWKRYNSLSARKSELANDANPAAPILSLNAVDNQTIVIKLKEANSTVLAQMAATFPGVFFIVPKEAENPAVLDLKMVGAGSGPFYLSSFNATANRTYKRNPGFKKDKRSVPYMDEAFYADIPEYATQLAQLKAGNIYDTFFNFRAEDLLPTKKDVPDLDLTPTLVSGLILRAVFGVGASSPFKDERVRQAWVLTWDRGLVLDVTYNVDKFKQSGIDVTTALDSGVQCGAWDGWWLDPNGKDFGPNAKFFKNDAVEAKKLLAAAGFANPVDADAYYVTPQTYQPQVDALIGMARDSGLFKVSIKVLSTADFNTSFRNNRGDFSGTGFITDNIDAHPVIDLNTHYHSSGGRYFGGDANVDQMLEAAAKEFDVKKQQQMVFDFQRYEGEKHFQPRLGGGSGFRISAQALRNKGVWSSNGIRLWANNWLDPDRPPLKK